MEKQVKGGYILVSLGLTPLSTSYSGSIDYDRISRTKKHIILTGIKIASTVMPDIAVKPIYGNGTITFEDVYGFNIDIHTDNSVDVSEYEETPNVEEAPSGTLSKMLGLDATGKVVKGSLPISGTKLYRHTVTNTQGAYESAVIIVSPVSTALTTLAQLGSLIENACSVVVSGLSDISLPVINYSTSEGLDFLTIDNDIHMLFTNTVVDTVTEL